MAINDFSKEERVAFEDILAGFNDALVISKNVAKFGTPSTLMERANDTIWRPMPYVLTSQTRTVGSAVTAQKATQLSVPSRLNQRKNVTWEMDALELRDALQEGRLGESAYQRLASDVNTSVRDVVSLQGTLVAKATGAIDTFDDIALAESIMSEQGIPEGDRYLALTTRDYNNVAGNLAGRQNLQQGKTVTAYDRAYVGNVAGFETFKIDAGRRLAANATAITIATNGAQVRYVPDNVDANGNNVDNRTQQVTVSTTTGVVVGDCFTIANIGAVHQITKEDTGQLKTFRVISIDSGTTMTISPPMIGANSSPTAPELQYKNIEVRATSATAAVTILNSVATGLNPFWHKSSIELLPGSYAVPTNQGVAIMRGTTDQGIEVVMGKKFDNSTFKSLYTLDVLYGVVNTNPQMNGVLIAG